MRPFLWAAFGKALCRALRGLAPDPPRKPNDHSPSAKEFLSPVKGLGFTLVFWSSSDILTMVMPWLYSGFPLVFLWLGVCSTLNTPLLAHVFYCSFGYLTCGTIYFHALRCAAVVLPRLQHRVPRVLECHCMDRKMFNRKKIKLMRRCGLHQIYIKSISRPYYIPLDSTHEFAVHLTFSLLPDCPGLGGVSQTQTQIHNPSSDAPARAPSTS